MHIQYNTMHTAANTMQLLTNRGRFASVASEQRGAVEFLRAAGVIVGAVIPSLDAVVVRDRREREVIGTREVRCLTRLGARPPTVDALLAAVLFQVRTEKACRGVQS